MWGLRYWASVYWAAVYWNKVGFAPPAGGEGIPTAGLGQKKSFSDATELGGGSW